MTPPLPSITLSGTRHAVSRIGLGAMPLSLEGRPDRSAAKEVIRCAVEEGITLIDTADAYALDDSDIGHNERLIAEALSEMGVRPDGTTSGSGPRVVVATKGGRTRPDGRWAHDGRPEHLRRACEASLRALGVERIPLYQLHAPDPAVPFRDSVTALAELREEGKVEAVGLSNVTVAQIRQALEIVPVASVQNPLSPWDVGYRRSPVVESCHSHGIVFLAYAPLGGRGRAGLLGASDAVKRLTVELGATPQELALAWLLSRGPVVVPIPGATRPSSVGSSARATALSLDTDAVARLTRAFRTLPGQRGLLERVALRLKRMLTR